MVDNLEQRQEIMGKIDQDINYINDEIQKVDKIKTKNTAPFLFILLLFSLAMLYSANNRTASTNIFSWGSLVVCGLLFIIFIFILREKEKKFKPIKKLVDELLIKMIGLLNPNLKFSQEDYVKQSIFYRSGLYTTAIRDYSGDNLIWGKLGQTNVMMSHIRAIKYEDRYYTQTIFNGIFMVAEFNKRFKGKTLVLPDIAGQSFGNIIGNWIQEINPRQEELVKLEDVEFEKKFVVYSADQIEARYILSPAIMEKLLYINEKFNGIAVSFVDNRVFIAFPSLEAYNFSIPYTQLIDKEVIWSKYEYLKNMIDIAEVITSELNLNNCIWTDMEEIMEEQQYNQTKNSSKEGEILKGSFVYITFFQAMFFSVLYGITACVVSVFLKKMAEASNNYLIENICNKGITSFIACLIAGLCIIPATNFAIRIFGFKHRIADYTAKKLSLYLLIIPTFGLLL